VASPSAGAPAAGLEPSVYGFILRYSLRQQLWLLGLTLVSFPFLYLSLDLPKRIVNEAIGGKGLPETVLGWPVDQVSYLMLLSGLFLALVFINGGFKYAINTCKGRLGERMLRRLRYELYARVLRFPLPRFRKMSAGEIIPMITAEVEPLGGFIGDALAQPVFQGGTLLVYLLFIFIQDPILGAAAVALYPFQGWLIPRLQRRVNQLGQQRVRAMRQIADRIGESVAGAQEVHNHDTSAWHLADLSSRYGEVYQIRFEIYQRKFFIKFLNNFINQLTPFFFYAIGGWLVIKGQLSFGALVAVLAAYKDLAAPWKELLDYYQQKEDIRIKYEQVIEQFQPPDLLDPALLTAEPPPGVALQSGAGSGAGSLVLSGVALEEDGGGARLLDGVSATLPLSGHTAVVNAGSSGADELMLLLARLLTPSAGTIHWNGHDFASLPESVTGRRIAYVGPTAVLFSGSLRDNLIYGLRHRPRRPAAADDGPAAAQRRRREALASGNSTDDPAADWLEPAIGADLEHHLRRVLDEVDLTHEVYELGLHGTLDPQAAPHTATRLLTARRALRAALADQALSDLVEPFDPERYNTNATVAENILFGLPVDQRLTLDTLAEHPYMAAVIERCGLTEAFLANGLSVAAAMTEMFAGLAPGHEFFERFSFIGAEELPLYQALLARAAKEGPAGLGGAERGRLTALIFKLVPARHRLGLFNPTIESQMLLLRRAFAADLPAELEGAIEFFHPERYTAAASLQDNILFGRVVHGQGRAAKAVLARLIRRLVDEYQLWAEIVAVGLDYPVGVGGSRLPLAQRQKVALARALLKQPDLLVLNDATSVLEPAARSRVHEAIFRACRGRGLIWRVPQAELARRFDLVLVLQAGQISESGSFEQLARPGGALHGLLAGP